MDINFLEIGTSNFETLLQSCKHDEIGISVEPLKFYLDDLPDKPNVEKVNIAITSNKPCDSINIFYIPPNVIDEQKLYYGFKGCNKIGNYHPLHIKYGLEKYVKIDKVLLVNIDDFLESRNIRTIKFLKIDAEGHDVIIMKGLYEYLKRKSEEYYPKKIQFETNENILSKRIDELITLFTSLGYIVISKGHDTLLEYKTRDNMHCL